jgi:hypothetical protein
MDYIFLMIFDNHLHFLLKILKFDQSIIKVK